MFKLLVSEKELYLTLPGEKEPQFVTVEGRELSLEHSLISISKWESKWKHAFISKREKTKEEMVDYYKCMTIAPKVSDILYQYLSQYEISQINNYMNDSMTATVVHDRRSSPPSREPMTSEMIYYLMLSNGIPIECEKWHINRLLTLIRLFSVKNGNQPKMSQKELAEYHKSVKAMNEAKMHRKR